MSISTVVKKIHEILQHSPVCVVNHHETMLASEYYLQQKTVMPDALDFCRITATWYLFRSSKSSLGTWKAALLKRSCFRFNVSYVIFTWQAGTDGAESLEHTHSCFRNSKHAHCSDVNKMSMRRWPLIKIVPGCCAEITNAFSKQVQLGS